MASVSNELKWRRREERKGNARFPNPTYIRWLRWVVPVSPAPHIFVGSAMSPTNMCHIFIGDVAPPTNIWGQSKSNRIAHICIGSRPKSMNITLNSSVLEPTNII
jgi:hypothetical protein